MPRPRAAALGPEDEDELDYAPGDEAEATEEAILDQATTERTIAELEAEIDTLRALEAEAAALRRSGNDTKWTQLNDILDHPLMVDAHGSRRKLIVFTEPRGTLNYLAERIRTRLGRPEAVVVILDESVWSPRDAAEVIRRDAADVMNVYVAEAGGLLKARQIFEMCESFGIPCMIGSMPEFGVGTAAQIHLGVAMSNLAFDSDTCGVLYHQDDLLSAPLRIEGGYAYPPEGPGLGVEVDQDVLARWHRAAA